MFSQKPVHLYNFPLQRYLTSPGCTPVCVQDVYLTPKAISCAYEELSQPLLSSEELNQSSCLKTSRFLDVVPCDIFLSPFPILCFQVSLFNYVFLISWAFALPYAKLRRLASSICTVWTCVIIVCKMLYQLQTIKPENFSVNCSLVSLGDGGSPCLAFREGRQTLVDPRPPALAIRPLSAH